MVRQLKWRVAIALVLTGLAAVAANAYKYRLNGNSAKREVVLPLKIGDWVGKEEIVTDRVKDLLEADTVLISTYFKHGQMIWFAMVYYKDNQIGFHTPESCFGGLGNKVFAEPDKTVFIESENKKFKIKNLRYRGDKGDKVLYYFYQVDDYSTDSYLNIRLKLLREQLKLNRPGVALFEMYAGFGEEKAIESLDEFVRSLVPILPSYLN
jgi:EpsI family protein